MRREIAEASQLLETQQAELVGIRKKVVDLIPSKLIPPVSVHLTWEYRECRKNLNVRHKKKTEELLKIQQKPLRRVENTVLVPENVKVPNYVMEVLFFRPKHAAKVKFDDMSFLADSDNCLPKLDDRDTETMKQLNAAAVWYCTAARKDKDSRSLDRAKMFLL